MFKKTKELSILSDVKSCCVIYSPGEADPAFFPSYEVVKGLFEKFMSMPMVERSQKMLTQEGYLTQRITSEIARNAREKKKNDMKEAQEDMNQIYEGKDFRELDVERLKKLSLLVADKLKEIEERERRPRQQATAAHPPPPLEEREGGPRQQAMAPPPPPPREMVGVEDLGSSVYPTWVQELMNDNWFMDSNVAFYQKDIPGPSCVISDLEIVAPEQHEAGNINAGENEEEVPEGPQ